VKRISPAAFTLEVKELILKRTGFRCDRCGLRAEYGHFHHRTPRRAGGSSRPDLGLPSNGLLLHPSCHDHIESKRKISAQLGFLVGYGTLPQNSPVFLWSGWHWLTTDGRAVKIDGVPPIVPVPYETEA
jgi:HNH endonuclease